MRIVFVFAREYTDSRSKMSGEDQELLELQNSAPIRYLDMYQSED